MSQPLGLFLPYLLPSAPAHPPRSPAPAASPAAPAEPGTPRGGFAASSEAPAGAAPTARRAPPAPSPQKPPRFVPRESWRRPLRAHAPALSILAARPRGSPSPLAAPAAGSVPGQLRSGARWDCPEPSLGGEAGRGGELERRRGNKINREK